MALMDISDEILVHIFGYLHSEDKVTLSETCCRFNHILCEKKLIRKLKYAASYKVTNPRLKKFLQPKLRCQNVEALDLTSCYWLTSTDILNYVMKLKNLRILYVADTHLNFAHLKKILLTLQLTRLSMSWRFTSETLRENVDNIKELSDRLESIKFLYMYLHMLGSPLSHVYYWLKYCKGLQELWIVSRTVEFHHVSGLMQGPQFPNLHTLVLRFPKSVYFYSSAFDQVLLTACTKKASWQKFWLELGEETANNVQILPWAGSSSFSGNALMAPAVHQFSAELESSCGFRTLKFLGIDKHAADMCTLENNLSQSQITHLRWHATPLVVQFPPRLTHLNVGCCCAGYDIINICQLVNLHSLSLPFCAFHLKRIDNDSGSTNQQEKTESSNQLDMGFSTSSRRTSRVTAHSSDSKLKILSQSLLCLKYLELTVCPRQCSTEFFVPDITSLSHISNWQDLQSLSLNGIPIMDSQFLIQIVRSCKFLHTFRLCRLGLSASCTYIPNLIRALKYCNNLRDFRLQQPNIGNVSILMEGLQQCPLLERVAVITNQYSRPPSIANCEKLINKCLSLVLLFLIVPAGSHSRLHQINTVINKKYKQSRPALYVRTSAAHIGSNECEQFPGIHYTEMVYNKSSVDIFPSNSDRFISHE